jgi:hypothetical protein
MWRVAQIVEEGANPDAGGRHATHQRDNLVELVVGLDVCDANLHIGQQPPR